MEKTVFWIEGDGIGPDEGSSNSGAATLIRFARDHSRRSVRFRRYWPSMRYAGSPES